MKRFCLLSIIAVMAGTARAEDQRLYNRRTLSGHEVQVTFHEHHDSRCRFASDVEINVTSAPQHGQVLVRPENHEITQCPAVGFVSCTGTTIRTQAVYYRPDPGFIGTDSFTYDDRLPQAVFHNRVV